MRSVYGHGEAVQRYISTGVVGATLAKEEPALIFQGNVSTNGLAIRQCCNDLVLYFDYMLLLRSRS